MYEKNIISFVIDRLHLDIIKKEKISHRESLSSSVYKLTLKDEKVKILKLPFNEKRFLREKYFLEKLKFYLPVPNLIDVILPEEGFSGAILMEFIPGITISPDKLTDTISYEMGKLLAKLHKIPCNEYKDIAEDNNDKKDALYMLRYKFYESYKECEGNLSFSLLEKAKKFFETNLKEIKTFDGPCIVHRDFRPGNILIKNDEILAVIDFENTLYSFDEEDFAQMEHLVWSKYPKTKNAFLHGYKSIKKLPDFETKLPLLRFCKALGAIGFTLVRKTYKGLHKHIYEDNLNYLKSLIG